eukprot:5121950-Pleurochrysis_carterae.AAC.1
MFPATLTQARVPRNSCVRVSLCIPFNSISSFKFQLVLPAGFALAQFRSRMDRFDGFSAASAMLDWTLFCSTYTLGTPGGGKGGTLETSMVPLATPARLTRSSKPATITGHTKQDGGRGLSAPATPATAPQPTQAKTAESTGVNGVHRAISIALAELAESAGADAPLVVVAHHIGCIPILYHLASLQIHAAAALPPAAA